MQDDYSTNSHYPHVYISLYKVGRTCCLNLGVIELSMVMQFLCFIIQITVKTPVLTLCAEQLLTSSVLRSDSVPV